MESENIITIDGNDYFFEDGETILQVARRNGIDIPTLCYLKGASPTGVCRICLVEVEGDQKTIQTELKTLDQRKLNGSAYWRGQADLNRRLQYLERIIK